MPDSAKSPPRAAPELCLVHRAGFEPVTLSLETGISLLSGLKQVLVCTFGHFNYSFHDLGW